MLYGPKPQRHHHPGAIQGIGVHPKSESSGILAHESGNRRSHELEISIDGGGSGDGVETAEAGETEAVCAEADGGRMKIGLFLSLLFLIGCEYHESRHRFVGIVQDGSYQQTWLPNRISTQIKTDQAYFFVEGAIPIVKGDSLFEFCYLGNSWDRPFGNWLQTSSYNGSWMEK